MTKKKKSVYDDKVCPHCGFGNGHLKITDNKRLCTLCSRTHQIERNI